MKTVNVVAAIIYEGKRIFTTQRRYGEFKDGWEFPGGKVEIGERPEDALKRVSLMSSLFLLLLFLIGLNNSVKNAKLIKKPMMNTTI